MDHSVTLLGHENKVNGVKQPYASGENYWNFGIRLILCHYFLGPTRPFFHGGPYKAARV